MKREIENIIIGGGIIGLSIGYNLAKQGLDVMVLESSHMNGGATGSSLGIIKTKLPIYNEDLTKLTILGSKIHENLSSETRFNTFYKRSGTLTISKNEKETKKLEDLHNRYIKHNIRDQRLFEDEIEKKWPYIDASSIHSAYFAPDEANVHPFSIVWAYLENIKEKGGKIKKQIRIESIDHSDHGYKIATSKEEYFSERLIIASGINSPNILRQLGYNFTSIPLQKELLISEPMRPFLGPTIQRLSDAYTVTQTMRGEIIGTVGMPKQGSETGETTPNFIYDMVSNTTKIVPSFRYLRIIRQWTGVMDKTLDNFPLLGRLDDEIYTAFGLHDLGITLAPIVGELITDEIITGNSQDLLKPFSPKRESVKSSGLDNEESYKITTREPAGIH